MNPLARLKDWLTVNALVILGGLLAAAAGVILALAVQINGLNLGKLVLVKGLRPALAECQTQRDTLQNSLALEQQRRAKEQQQALQSYEGQDQSCRAEIGKARTATRIITEIIHAPPPDTIPARADSIDADRLRGIWGQTPAVKAAGLPGGSDRQP